MMSSAPHPGYSLATNPYSLQGRLGYGFATPSEDIIPQTLSIPPRRVIPIIFLPGIMGSNLRMSTKRQKEMGRNNNISWRPDNSSEAKRLIMGDSAMRQSQLDPRNTEVDEYDPKLNPTGDMSEKSDQRHDNVKVKVTVPLNVGLATPLLMDDPVGALPPKKTKDQKARERGWGEIFFNSYRGILEMCEQRLNTVFYAGKMDSWWTNILGVAPSTWGATAATPLQPLDEETLKNAVAGCWFPVHAMGYNWLQSNRDSSVRIAERINALISRYQEQGYQCEKVIVVTHSMGGLVGRALVHPEMGKMHDKVLGIVHGVMPAIGAAAAYKRMRCGFEDPGLASMSPIASVVAKALGNFGPEVTAVLGNAQGGLELLPSCAYGNHWLRVNRGGELLKSLPEKGDPYEEIYKVQGKWYGLLREDWINPANLATSGMRQSLKLLDSAKKFHLKIDSTYHERSYAHYGADPTRAAWHQVNWDIEPGGQIPDIEDLTISDDNLQGKIIVQGSGVLTIFNGAPRNGVKINLRAAADPGDQTVPLHSADAQLRSKKLKGIFRQTGYEHQNSYQDVGALHSTVYSLIRIAQTMTWSK